MSKECAPCVLEQSRTRGLEPNTPSASLDRSLSGRRHIQPPLDQDQGRRRAGGGLGASWRRRGVRAAWKKGELGEGNSLPLEHPLALWLWALPTPSGGCGFLALGTPHWVGQPADVLASWALGPDHPAFMPWPPSGPHLLLLLSEPWGPDVLYLSGLASLAPEAYLPSRGCAACAPHLPSGFREGGALPTPPPLSGLLIPASLGHRLRFLL